MDYCQAVGTDSNEGRLDAIESEIKSLRDKQGELQKERQRREIDAIAYNNESCAIQSRLEELFAEYDTILDERGAAQLDKAAQEMFAEFFAAAKEQTAFDKEVFMRLVKSVKIFSKDNIVFELRNGTKIKGETA